MIPALDLPGLAAVSAAVLVSAIKWLRVAQREHYLPGSILAMRRVWIAGRLWNLAEPALAAAAAVGWVIRPAPLWPLPGAVALLVFPLGLALRGRTSPLVWTTRLKRTAVLVAAVLVGGTALTTWPIVVLTGRPAPGAIAIVALLLSYAAPDIALRIAGPLEKRLSQRFVDSASLALARIDPVVVGITGSYGKTSTKWYVHQLVEGTRRVVASPASFNNRLGLAQAVNDHLTSDAEVFIAEMGTYQRGEIAEICTWIPPSIAVLTAIGPVHLQRFGTEERILAAKTEIIAEASVVALNVDHPSLRGLARSLAGDQAGPAGVRRIWRCGTTDAATDVRVRTEGDQVAIVVRGERIGGLEAERVFPANLACAVAVALELGVRAADIADRAGRLTQTRHRQSIGRSARGFAIIDDTFNSNPAGAARALEVLAGHGGPRARRVVVTPGMIEMGRRQRGENTRFAAAASVVADDLLIVGRTNRRSLVDGARHGEASVTLVDTREEAVAWVRGNLGPGDAVLYENDLPDHYP